MMLLNTATWLRDSHELYDYESRSVEQASFNIQSSMRIYRRGAEVFAGPDSDGGMNFPPLFTINTPNLLDISGVQDEKPVEYLLRAVYLDGRCIVQSPERQSENSLIQAKKLWVVVKEIGQYVLSEGDVIKLGRFKLRVRQICTGPENDPVRPDFGTGEHSTAYVAGSEANGLPCRICLLEGSGGECEDDPLIQACNCRGSIQYVHLGCLRYWINGRLCLTSSDNSHRHAYLFRQLACELCKFNYPLEVQHLDGTKAPLVPMPETKAPYIVLENMMRSENGSLSGNGSSYNNVSGGNGIGHNNNSNQPLPMSTDTSSSRGVFVISLAGKKTLKLGRGHESDVRIADVSISRWHATVSFIEESGHFVLEDNSSKFGTLVAMRRHRVVDPPPLMAKSEDHKTVAERWSKARLCVQAGRTLFKFNYPPEIIEERPLGSILTNTNAGNATTPQPPSISPVHERDFDNDRE